MHSRRRSKVKKKNVGVQTEISFTMFKAHFSRYLEGLKKIKQELQLTREKLNILETKQFSYSKSRFL